MPVCGEEKDGCVHVGFSGYVNTDFYCVFICVHSLNSAGFSLLLFKADDKFSSSNGKRTGLVSLTHAVGSHLRLSCRQAIPHTHMQCGIGTPFQLSDLMCRAWVAHTFSFMTDSTWLISSGSMDKVLEPQGNSEIAQQEDLVGTQGNRGDALAGGCSALQPVSRRQAGQLLLRTSCPPLCDRCLSGFRSSMVFCYVRTVLLV